MRPGFNRIATTNDGDTLITAYRNTNSTAFTIVAINPTGFSMTPTFNLQNFPAVLSVTPWLTSPDVSLAAQSAVAVTNAAFTYTLPGLSVATFVGQANNPPALAAINNQTINPGVTLVVTNAASDPDLPAQSLTFTLLNSPTNATLTTLSPDYTLLTSTNLAVWQLRFTTNPTAMPVIFTDTNFSNAARFYRLQLGP